MFTIKKHTANSMTLGTKAGKVFFSYEVPVAVSFDKFNFQALQRWNVFTDKQIDNYWFEPEKRRDTKNVYYKELDQGEIQDLAHKILGEDFEGTTELAKAYLGQDYDKNKIEA